MFPYTEILFKPGSKYSYSNPGVIFLGQVIERLSGDDIESTSTRTSFKPLGMTHSYFDLTPVSPAPGSFPTAGRPDGGKTTPLGLDFDTALPPPTAGSTAPSPIWRSISRS